ncbi:MAG: hypothetical protein JWQ92_271 [Amnibacterium sp.]|nr:hypothetical protein [Amnibacterium sp.]
MGVDSRPGLGSIPLLASVWDTADTAAARVRGPSPARLLDQRGGVRGYLRYRWSCLMRLVSSDTWL